MAGRSRVMPARRTEGRTSEEESICGAWQRSEGEEIGLRPQKPAKALDGHEQGRAGMRMEGKEPEKCNDDAEMNPGAVSVGRNAEAPL
jgi:hypothetical protein